jgi:glyoxylase-like metal-dependent hydrolase (beta-lactamase superfamily II)
MMQLETFILGIAQTNAYLVADADSGEAVVIDPAWEGATLQAAVERHGWKIHQVWCTHAHFDHIGGAAALMSGLQPAPSLALHPADLPLWRAQGGAPLFGLRLDSGPEPQVALAHGQKLHLGALEFEVRHAPGHTPGHVLFYCAAEGVMFCGDVIFAGSIGRTDLPGGDYATLLHSIHTQVLSLPDATRLLSGHGEETSVGWEKRWNPFLT